MFQGDFFENAGVVQALMPKLSDCLNRPGGSGSADQEQEKVPAEGLTSGPDWQVPAAGRDLSFLAKPKTDLVRKITSWKLFA